jgi:hypothetical protein
MDTRFFRQQTAVQSSDSLEVIPREMFHVVLCGFMWFINVAECGQWAPLATWGCSSLSQWLISTVLFCPFG